MIGFSSNIFVPAIPTLAGAFNRSEGDISQAVTVYLAFQAVTPPLFGAMSDSFGRRPLYLATLSVYCGATAGLACMPTSQYWVLLFLRGLQVSTVSRRHNNHGGFADEFAVYGRLCDSSNRSRMRL